LAVIVGRAVGIVFYTPKEFIFVINRLGEKMTEKLKSYS